MAGYSEPCAMGGNTRRIDGWTPVEMIALRDAVLCVNCEYLTPAKNGHCLRCGSTALIHAGRLINRELEAEPDPLAEFQVAISDATGEA